MIPLDGLVFAVGFLLFLGSGKSSIATGMKGAGAGVPTAGVGAATEALGVLGLVRGVVMDDGVVGFGESGDGIAAPTMASIEGWWVAIGEIMGGVPAAGVALFDEDREAGGVLSSERSPPADGLFPGGRFV